MSRIDFSRGLGNDEVSKLKKSVKVARYSVLLLFDNIPTDMILHLVSLSIDSFSELYISKSYHLTFL